MRIFTDIEWEARPPLWKNEHPLAREEPMPLEAFPIIDDFEIVLERVKDSSQGYGIAFFSEKRGYCANFPDWDHVELDLYLPSFTIPFYGISDETEWEIEIFHQAEFTCVIESDFEHSEAGYHRWFKVPTEIYQTEWQAAIEAGKQ